MQNFFGYYLKCQNEEETVAFIVGRHKKDGEVIGFLQIVTDEGTWKTEFPADCFEEKKNNIYLANNLGVDMGMVYRRRNYSTIVNGRNPIVAHEFLGTDVEGKDMIIMDDMLSSGNTLIEVSSLLKKMGARNIYFCATFGMFTNGLERINQAYKEGLFTNIFTTNLVYQRPELQQQPYYHCCDLSKYIALLIDTLNHDTSISDLLDPAARIQKVLRRYADGEEI